MQVFNDGFLIAFFTDLVVEQTSSWLGIQKFPL